MSGLIHPAGLELIRAAYPLWPVTDHVKVIEDLLSHIEALEELIAARDALEES